jgi:tRNA 2-thiouridine synthesizing protein A
MPRLEPVTPHQPPAPGIRPGGPGPAALTIDALGKKCPIPIIMLAERIREVAIGELVEVLADDPAAESDLPAWCRLKSQEHVLTRQLPAGCWSFLIRRCY